MNASKGPVMNGPEILGPRGLFNRRRWIQSAGGGFGLIGLAGLLQGEGLLGAEKSDASPCLNPMAVRPPHFPARAKRVIWVFTNGGPSQVDTWEYKPPSSVGTAGRSASSILPSRTRPASSRTRSGP